MELLLRLAVVMLVDGAAAQVEEPAPVDSETQAPVDGEALFADDAELLAEGTNVHLENVVVRAKSGLMMRVAVGRHQIYVAPVDPSMLEFLAVGATVDVRGTLRRAPSAPQARLAYAMSSHEARRLARQGVYLDAWSLGRS
ncbi:MAG TPA: hypothetical protein VM513_20315 [Kofleriaceae bacterium]|nr:hypothetical protein [Kofleriaceae bacterium]